MFILLILPAKFPPFAADVEIKCLFDVIDYWKLVSVLRVYRNSTVTTFFVYSINFWEKIICQNVTCTIFTANFTKATGRTGRRMYRTCVCT